MDTKQVILELRTQKGMSQDELAEKVFVSRQAVVEIKNDLIRTMGECRDVQTNTKPDEVHICDWDNYL